MSVDVHPGRAEPSYRERVGYQAGLLGGFAMIAAALLVIGDLSTRDLIAQRRAEDLLASLGQVIPAERYDQDLLAHVLILQRSDAEPVKVYRALQGLEVSAVAFQVTGQGYAGPIELILGIDPAGQVLGARVLSHTETPGLGDKIEIARDPWIQAFEGRALGDPPAERWAVKKDGGDFDQFSGATITPRAVVRAIKDGLGFFQQHRDALLASAVIQRTEDATTP
jgi:electron transport complex protein RnfG